MHDKNTYLLSTLPYPPMHAILLSAIAKELQQFFVTDKIVEGVSISFYDEDTCNFPYLFILILIARLAGLDFDSLPKKITVASDIFHF